MFGQNALQNILKQNLVKILGIEKMPEEQKNTIVEKAIEIIQKKIASRVMEELKDEDKNEFIKISEGKNQMAIAIFLQKKIPNLNKIFMEEMTKIKQELI
ncbi:MAG: DUF5663 domain-containing protein [Patescibacteria group bacterium]